MRFVESFTIEQPAEKVWQFLEDPKRLALCVPGVETVEPLDDGRSKVRMTQKVGYLSATFDLRMHVSSQQPGKSVELTSIGRSVRGAIGELRSTNRVELTPIDGKTQVDLIADIGVGGMLGSVGQKVMASKAKEVARQFATTMNQRIHEWVLERQHPATPAASSEDDNGEAGEKRRN